MHDWFSHGKNEAENPWLVPLDAGRPVACSTRWRSPRTRRDPSADADGPPTFVTDDTHWWDGSQIYGREPAFAQAIRTGEHGKLRIDEHGLIPQEIEAQVDLTGVAGNFWVGLALLHSLFMREHNAFCDHLHATHPELSDDELYDKGAARRRGADGEDPHGRLDAGDHRAPDDGDGAAHELVGPRGRAARPAARPTAPRTR